MAHDRQALAELCYRVALAEGEFSGEKPPNMTDRLKAVDLICRLQLTPPDPNQMVVITDDIRQRIAPSVGKRRVKKCEE